MDNELDFIAKKKKGKNDISESLPEGAVGGGSELYLMSHESVQAVKEALEIETNVPPNIDNVPRELHNMRGRRPSTRQDG